MSANSAPDRDRPAANRRGEAKPVLAIDFGTSNTYVTKCPGDREEPVGVDFGEGRDGIATAILYRGPAPPLIGDMALEEHGEGVADHPEYDLHAQFKPDLATSAEARRNARDFLSALLALARRRNQDIAPAEREVIFGIPSEASEAFREALHRVAEEAGFGAVKTVDEPKGAIYFHIHRRDLTPEEALKGALVVDFGGGTCDFALLVRGEVRHSWGDMHLGGRLFDDLFFQWFLEQNPDALPAMRRTQAELFMLWVRSREAKEKFSLAMTLDRTATFRRAMGEYGRLSDLTWDGFLARAARYRPSETFASRLQASNPAAYARLTGNPAGLDLLAWFRDSLREGLSHARMKSHRPACVLLTGGSSAWPFVAEIVRKELGGLDGPPRTVQSDRPYVTVSQGLAIVPALQVRLAATQEALRGELPGFVAERVVPLVERRLEESAEGIAERVAAALFDSRIEPVLRRVREEGGSVAALKARIAEQAAAFKPEIEAIVSKEVGRILSGLAADTTELMQAWYREHRLAVGEELTPEGIPSGAGGELHLVELDIYGAIQKVVWTLSTSLVAALVASISGGAGTALVASGPLGLTLGTVIGLVVGALAVAYGVEEARLRAEAWEGTPKWLLRRALSDAKIAGLRQDIKDQVAAKVRGQTRAAGQAIQAQIAARVAREIDNLSAIAQFF